MGSEDSFPVDLELESWLDHQKELADRSPAVWWDDHLSYMKPQRAEHARTALQRITSRGRGRGRGEVLQALRIVSYRQAAPPITRRQLLARAKEIQRLLEAARKTTVYSLYYPVAALYNAVLTIHDDAPGHLAELRSDAEMLRRDGEGPMNRAILELLREVARAAGGPHYEDVAILLGAVRVQRSVRALTQLAFRAGGGLSRPPVKLTKSRAPRGRPRKSADHVHAAGRKSRRGWHNDSSEDG